MLRGDWRKATIAEPDIGDASQVKRAQRERKKPRRHRVRRWLVSLVVLVMAAVIAGWPVYVRPQIDALRHADAIFVLGGYSIDRATLADRLNTEGWAPVVVFSASRGPAMEWFWKRCATPHPHLRVHCFTPDPPTTRGEAKELRRLAAEYGWRTVIVVTFRPHISRARFILQQCFDGDLIMVESPARLSPAMWAYQYVYQTAGYVRAVLERGC